MSSDDDDDAAHASDGRDTGDVDTEDTPTWLYLLHCKALPAAGRREMAYFGKAVDPDRRLRQHRGEIVGGAKKTRGRNPTTVLRVGPFKTHTDVLQAEWACQHPRGRRTRGRRLTGTLTHRHRWKKGMGTLGAALDAMMTVFARQRWTARARPASEHPAVHVRVCDDRVPTTYLDELARVSCVSLTWGRDGETVAAAAGRPTNARQTVGHDDADDGYDTAMFTRAR